MNEPKYKEIETIKVVGLGAKLVPIVASSSKNLQVIPKLWDHLNNRLDEIQNRIGDSLYGYCEEVLRAEPGDHHEIFYAACAEVEDEKLPPPGMIGREIPGGRYAVFTHKGSLENLQQTMNYIYKTWARQPEIELARSRFPIEVFDARFVPGSDKSEMDIYVPVESQD